MCAVQVVSPSSLHRAPQFNRVPRFHRAPGAPTARYGLATEPPPDAFADRKDIVGFTKRRRTFVPFLKKHEITHPVERVQGGDQNVIILDIDELGTTGSNTTTTGAHAGNGVHVGSAMFLSVVGVLAFYGTYASVKEFIESTKELKELKEEKAEFKKGQDAILSGTLSAAGKKAALRPYATLMQDNRHARAKAHVDRVFMGAFGGTGATLVGASILANAQMFGALSPALAAAASPIMFAATPLVTVFGTGVAAFEAYRIAKTFRVSRRIPKALQKSTVGNEALAKRLLRRRLTTIRYVSGLKGASYLGLAIGVPMTVFGGPYGLPLLLASAGGMVLAGVLEGALTGYSSQLTAEDKLRLRDTHDYVNAIEHTHGRLKLLKQLRRDKKLHYPHGGESFFPVGALVRGFTTVRRGLTGGAKRYPSPERRLMQFMHDFAVVEEGYAQRHLDSAHHRVFKESDSRAPDADLRMKELTQDTRDAAENFAQMRLEHNLHPADSELAVRPEEAVFTLMQFFVRAEFLRSFGLELIGDRKLREAFSHHGIVSRSGREWHFDANRLVLYFVRKPTAQTRKLLHQTFKIAEKALATTERKRMRSKERQLLDLFSEHITTRAPRKTKRRIGSTAS